MIPIVLDERPEPLVHEPFEFHSVARGVEDAKQAEVVVVRQSVRLTRLDAATQGSARLGERFREVVGEVRSADADRAVGALFVLDPAVMGGSLGTSFGYDDLFVQTWFVASVATLGGALGTGLESDEAIRAAAYSKREEERRARLADERA